MSDRHITIVFRLKPEDQTSLVQLQNHPKACRFLMGDHLRDDPADVSVMREVFEERCIELMTLKREAGVKIHDDNGSPVTHESLFWRNSDGSYGVDMFNAAWQGFLWGVAMRGSAA